ncbi:MAG: hypothetical protein DI626_01480 [Micavibrio aeruginosavorus]|uniref:Helix-turn-helix domain-containing protein n=1 Tax=Micavibrio aeruginosavorus TaxID=349221 RepID=A0A2W5A7X2_9BACT|nr:MAG: hypothetical protein DI626_01480 [Micavibrio aeruginosavorus]
MPDFPMEFWEGQDRGLTFKEAAEILGYSRWTIARMIERGELKAYGEGKKKRIPLSSVVQYSTTHTVANEKQIAAKQQIKRFSKRFLKTKAELERLLK